MPVTGGAQTDGVKRPEGWNVDSSPWGDEGPRAAMLRTGAQQVVPERTDV